MQKKISQLYCFIDEYNYAELSKLSKNINIIYRNYKKNIDISTLISIRNYCKKNKIKFFISNNIKLAIKYQLNGIYIPAFNNSLNHLAYTFKKNFKIIGSAHNLKEIRTKENQNVEKIFLSSLFKQNKNYLGINRFRLLSNLTKKKVVVLGGVSKENFKKLKLLKKIEFAGISYFE